MANNPTHESIAMATFDSTDDAEQAVEALHDAGFTTDQVRYSKQYEDANLLESIKALLVFPDERQDESESDVNTMVQNMGISADEVQYYSDALAKGTPVVIVRPDNRSDEAEGILRDNKGSGYKGR